MRLISRPKKLGFDVPVRLEPRPHPDHKGQTRIAIIETMTSAEALDPTNPCAPRRSEFRLVSESPEDTEAIREAGLSWMCEPDPPADPGPPVRGYGG